MLSKEELEILRRSVAHSVECGEIQRDFTYDLLENIDALQERINKLEENTTAQALALKAAKAMQQAETDRADKAEAECNHWKANHENQVRRARIMMERPDMPIERVKAYKRMQELEALADANERDAERYRHIRTKERMMLDTDDGEARMTTTFSSADEFDDAIDQAMNNV